MRDPERVARVLEKLRALWLSRPDMRLGQLLMNLNAVNESVDKPADSGEILQDIWSREDLSWECLLDRVLKEGHF